MLESQQSLSVVALSLSLFATAYLLLKLSSSCPPKRILCKKLRPWIVSLPVFGFPLPLSFPFSYVLYRLVTMSSKGCCMSRKPPSPDGLAPRHVPARFPQGSAPTPPRGRQIPLQYFLSLSSDSPLSKQEDIAELQAIFEDDKSSTEGGQNCVRAKKSSSTITSVKNRLKKHLSRELRSKRHSKSSIGTSDDSERRAELRRFRQKRIQEELSNEGVYDSDAKSLSSMAGVFTYADKDNQTIWISGGHSPLPALVSAKLPISDLPLPLPSRASPSGKV